MARDNTAWTVRRAIVAPFVRGYARGESLNPCIACNGSFRFAELLAFADRAGARRLATGHYARIVRHRGRLLLARAEDPLKDQSYMLARLDPRFLERLWFPLGDQTKDATRAEAERAGLAAARRAESQEACFLAGDDYRTFLARHGLPAERGAIVDEDGREVGAHDGFCATPRDSGAGWESPRVSPSVAVRTDAATNTVVVGPRAALATTTVSARGRLSTDVTRVDAKLRYRSEPLAADVERRDGGFVLTLDEPAYGVARGQAAVLYEPRSGGRRRSGFVDSPDARLQLRRTRLRRPRDLPDPHRCGDRLGLARARRNPEAARDVD